MNIPPDYSKKRHDAPKQKDYFINPYAISSNEIMTNFINTMPL